nr:hypothetical protein [Massilia violaceinigra]
MAGTRQIEMSALMTTAMKIGSPPMRATVCEWTFWTPKKSASSAGPCSLACLITSRVSKAEATKLTRNENIIIYICKNAGRLVPYPADQRMRSVLPSP